MHQIEYILTRSRPGTLLKSLQIMYKSLPRNMNAVQATTMFIAGLKENNFFAYTEFLRGLRG